ncbi:hypothetical protein [Eleftheria terrae]|uniref:hypothetical protein n=1 Tax=Eleftheria terrae TaxID=1597781 RepID=UPI00263B88DA|nr:hypothetical protein [Eleftheria terrae]WKB54129.1 hypothetical protein N7L95_06985 [Eleftheria terrae]
MNLCSVNDVLDRLSELSGRMLAVHGFLRVEFEHVALWHVPEKERRRREPTSRLVHDSSLWLRLHSEGPGPDRHALRAWHGHIVTAVGIVHRPRSSRGCGHLACWPAELEVMSIQTDNGPFPGQTV